MKKIVIAIDVDGTLNDTEKLPKWGPLAFEDIRSLVIILSKFKNTKIIVWSGSGELWARQCVERLGLKKYVNGYASKNLTGRDEEGHPMFDPGFKPDIAIDDIQSCELGIMNLIVGNKR